MNDDFEPRHFQLDAQYRRCGLYVAVAFLAMGFLALWVERILPGRPGGAKWILWGTALAGLLPLRWRMRIDSQGVWRRRIGRWRLWSWDDFASGRIRYGVSDRRLVDPALPWWRRELSLETLSPMNSDLVWKWISLAWVRPEPVAVPATLEFGTGELLRRPVRMNAEGLEIGAGRRQQRFSWNQVIRLEIKRWRHEREDFYELLLQLPDRKIHLRRQRQYGIESRNWKGAEPEVIAQFLQSRVPPDRRCIVAKFGAPQSPEERVVRIAQAEKTIRELRRGGVFMSLLIAAAFAWAIYMAHWGILITLPVQGLLFGSVRWFGLRRAKAELDLLHQRAEKSPAPTLPTPNSVH